MGRLDRVRSKAERLEIGGAEKGGTQKEVGTHREYSEGKEGQEQ